MFVVTYWLTYGPDLTGSSLTVCVKLGGARCSDTGTAVGNYGYVAAALQLLGFASAARCQRCHIRALSDGHMLRRLLALSCVGREIVALFR
jgi:hypothetical protein